MYLYSSLTFSFKMFAILLYRGYLNKSHLKMIFILTSSFFVAVVNLQFINQYLLSRHLDARDSILLIYFFFI